MGVGEAQALVEREHIPYPVLIDQYHRVSKQWDSMMCSRVWLANRHNKIVYVSQPGVPLHGICCSVREHLQTVDQLQ